MDDTLTRRAERAALGAMISDRHLAARLGILEPRDFTDPRHRTVFQAIRMLAGTPQPSQAGWRDLIAATAGKAVTTAYLDGLAASCPPPGHGPAYAAMLIQASRLAHSNVSAQPTPLRAAHDLHAQLRRRTAAIPQPAPRQPSQLPRAQDPARTLPTRQDPASPPAAAPRLQPPHLTAIPESGSQQNR